MRRGAPIAVALLLLLLPLSSAEETGKKQEESRSGPAKTLRRAGRHFVEDAKKVGRSIRDSKAGQAVKGAGKEIADDAAGAGKEISPVAEKVREATRHFWRDLISTKRKAVQALRKENARLKSKEGAKQTSREPAQEAR